MSRLAIDQVGTEVNMELCLEMLKTLDIIEITKIEKNQMPNYCAEVFFKSDKSYSEIREVIDSLRSRGYYMMVVIGISNVKSILISNIYEKVRRN